MNWVFSGIWTFTVAGLDVGMNSGCFGCICINSDESDVVEPSFGPVMLIP